MRTSNVEPGHPGPGAHIIHGRRAGARLRGVVLLAVLVAAAAAGLAACGGGASTSSAAAAGSGPSASNYQNAVKYAQCMRSHGVPNFPDPASNGAFSANGLNMKSPQFQSAQNDCKQFAAAPPSQAQQAQQFAAALKYSQCMRSHGVPNYPDPSRGSNGAISNHMRINQGNPNSPQFQRAQQACRKLPGAPPQAVG